MLASHVLLLLCRCYKSLSKGGWRRASFKTVNTKKYWTLWASSAAANWAQLLADLKHRVESILLTKGGLVPLYMTNPSARNALLGPVDAAYGNQGVLKGFDGAMGSEYEAKESRILAHTAPQHSSPTALRHPFDQS